MCEALSFEGEVKCSVFDGAGTQLHPYVYSNRPWKPGKIIVICSNTGIAESLEMYVNATSTCIHKWMVRDKEILLRVYIVILICSLTKVYNKN